MTRSESVFGISLALLWRLFKRSWYWFTLSILCALGINWLYQVPHDDYDLENACRMAVRSRLPFVNDSAQYLWQKTPPYAPNILFSIVNSADAVEQAGQAIGFDVSYRQKERAISRDVYNSLPYRIRFLEAYQEDVFTLQAQETLQGVKLSHLKGMYHNVPISIDAKDYEVVIPIGSVVETPVGKVAVEENPGREHFGEIKYNPDKKLYVTRRSFRDVKTQFDTDLELYKLENNTIIVFISTLAPQRMISQFLVEMSRYAEEQVRLRLQEDLDEAYKAAAEATLQTQVTPTEKALLQQVQERIAINQEAIKHLDCVEVVEKPIFKYVSGNRQGEQSSKKGAWFRLFLLMVMAFTLPLFIIYLYHRHKGVVLEWNQLPQLWRNKTLLEHQIALQKGQLDYTPDQLDALRYAIELSIAQEDSGKPILFTTPTNTLDSAKRLQQLVQALVKKGTAIHLLDNALHKQYPELSGIDITGSYWCSAQHLQHIAPSVEQRNWITAPYNQLSLLAPSASVVIVWVEQEGSNLYLLPDVEHTLNQSTTPWYVLWAQKKAPRRVNF